MRSPSRATWAIVGTGLACLACHYLLCEHAPYTNVLSRDLSAANLDSEEAVQRVVSNAVASRRAVLLIHVDWAPMEQQRRRYIEFMLNFRRTHPTEDVQFHYVDCTAAHGYGPLHRISGWREHEGEPRQSLIHGMGEIVWLENGHLLRVERILRFETVEQIVELTEQLMPPSRSG